MKSVILDLLVSKFIEIILYFIQETFNEYLLGTEKLVWFFLLVFLPDLFWKSVHVTGALTSSEPVQSYLHTFNWDWETFTRYVPSNKI